MASQLQRNKKALKATQQTVRQIVKINNVIGKMGELYMERWVDGWVNDW